MVEAAQKNEVYRRASCPFGKKAVKLLEEQEIAFADHVFESPEQEQDFKSRHKVSTTPLIFLDGTPVGGYDELAKRFNP